MSNRYLGGFITATFNPLAAPVAPTSVEYLVVAGGGGGACNEVLLPTSLLGATETVTIGSGGTAGTGGSLSAGNHGGAGGNRG